ARAFRSLAGRRLFGIPARDDLPRGQRQRCTMRIAAASGSRGLRTLLSGLPVCAVGRQDGRGSGRRRAPGVCRAGVTPPILLAGAGRMGGALLKGWIERGIRPLFVLEPHPSLSLRRLATTGSISLHKNPEEVSAALRAVVIALKPQVLRSEAEKLRPIARSGALMISIAAGTTIRSLKRAWGKNARVIRAMPNTPGAIGRGISALYAPAGIRAADRKLAQNLLVALGDTLWVKRESLIDSVTAVSGSGPAYVFLLVEALAEAAR